MVLLLNLVGFSISTRPRWSGGNVLYLSCTSSEGASRGGQPLNIFTWLIGAGGCTPTHSCVELMTLNDSLMTCKRHTISRLSSRRLELLCVRATHWHTLQHTATHGNTQQRTATQRNTHRGTWANRVLSYTHTGMWEKRVLSAKRVRPPLQIT